MRREKNYNIEELRVIACIMVICIHVSNYYSRGYGQISNASYIFSIILNGICRVAVPLFFMISGSLLLEETILIKKSVRRAAHMLGVLLLWSGIYYFWNLFYRQKQYDFHLLFEEPVKKHLWFLYAILGMYIALPFLQCLFKDMQDILMRYFVLLWFLCLTVDYVIALSDMEITYQIPLVGTSCYLGYFVLGYIIKNTLKKVPISPKFCYFGAAFALAVTILATYIGTVVRGVHDERFFEYRNVMIAAGSALIYYNALKNVHKEPGERTKKVLSFLSKHSFTIYLSHVIFLDIMKKEMNPRGISAFIGIPLFTIWIFGMSLLLSVIWNGVRKWIHS
ncbi:MAG: acyltransferase [Lachnospiraceae bacterium]